MNDACPHCGCSLKQRPPKSQPLPGQHRIWAWRTGLVCQACGGWVRRNPHPREQQLDLIDAILWIAATWWWIRADDVRTLLSYGLLSGLARIGLALWLRRRAPTWPCYLAAPPP